jgi:hypothetical protein
MPMLDLFWYDGGVKPRLPEQIEAQNVELAKEGILFIGDEGAILAGFHGENPRRFARGSSEPLGKGEAVTQAAKRAEKDLAGRNAAWIQAVKGGAPSPGSFLNAASITDAVNLGTVALRAEKKVLFDSASMKITNLAGANKYLYRTYRKGWEL